MLPSSDGEPVPKYTLEDLGPAPTGHIGFIKFSMAILSVVPNSAAIERLFSQFGIVHTKLRNRLGSEKVRKSVVVRVDAQTKSGTGATRKHRLVDEQEGDEVPMPTPVTRDPPPPFTATGRPRLQFQDSRKEFRRHVDRMLEESDEMDEESIAGEAMEAVSNGAHEPRLSSSRRKTALKIKNLFAFPEPGSPLPGSLDRVARFWKEGEKGLELETLFHEEVSRELAPESEEADADVAE